MFKQLFGAEAIAQWLRTLVILPEGLYLVLRVHIVAHNYL